MSNKEEFNHTDLEDKSYDTIENEIISPDNSDNGNSNGNIQHGNDSNTLYQEGFGPDKDKEKVTNRGPNWAALPYYAVENIYTFLSRADQSRMSQVCSRWAEDFEAPSLWKRMTFQLKARKNSSEIYPEVKFAHKYAYMFQHVKIIGTQIESDLLGVIWEQLKLFLQAMTYSSQLISITFINMSDCLMNLDNKPADFFETISTFFKSQEKLRTVTFEDKPLCKTIGLEILKAVFHSNTNIIINFEFNILAYESSFDILIDDYFINLSEVCDNIVKVRRLEMNYSEIFEDLIRCLHEKIVKGTLNIEEQKPVIPILTICNMENELPKCKGIPPETWKYLSNAFPNMKVHMFAFVYSHSFSQLETVLVKDIPIESLLIGFKSSSTTLMDDVRYFFIHLQFCLYQIHLKDFYIAWIPPNTDFDDIVIPFLQSCQKLRRFYLFVHLPPARVGNILKALYENHPKSLKFLRISFENYENSQDENNLRELSEKYFLLFNTLGIKCILGRNQNPNRILQEDEIATDY